MDEQQHSRAQEKRECIDGNDERRAICHRGNRCSGAEVLREERRNRDNKRCKRGRDDSRQGPSGLHHAVCPRQQAVRNQHRVGRIKRRVVEGAGRSSQDANAHQHPEMKASRQHEDECQKRNQPTDGVRHDHDLFAIVAVCPGAGERASENEGNREPEIENCEG